MENPNKGENQLKTFNTAKLYAEAILFPKLSMYQEFQKQADFGITNLNGNFETTQEIRDIQRYNGLKGMCETLHNLLINISSTVKLKNNKGEISQLELLLSYLDGLKKLFYEDKSKFFISTFKPPGMVETLDRDYFEKVKANINICYINTEMLMTKNKLIFADDKDDFMSDQEILEQIKREYIEG